MYRLFHYLFGWDYVVIEDSYGCKRFQRIRKTPNGVEYIKGNTGFVELSFSHKHVTRPR